MKKPHWPKLHIDSNIVDLLVGTRLLLLGITDAKSYFYTWPKRIVVWLAVGAVVGAWMGGISGMLWGALVGLVIPIFMLYFSIILPMVMAQVAGLLLGIAWVLFCLWLLFSLLFR